MSCTLACLSVIRYSVSRLVGLDLANVMPRTCFVLGLGAHFFELVGWTHAPFVYVHMVAAIIHKNTSVSEAAALDDSS